MTARSAVSDKRRLEAESSETSVALPDIWLLAVTYLLLMIGVAMVYSATIAIHERHEVDQFYFMRWHLIAAAAGTAVMFVMVFISPKLLQENAFVIMAVAVVLLIVVLIPFFGRQAGGSYRWFKVVRFQPSEFAKLALVIYLADVFTRKRNRLDDFKKGLLGPVIVTLAVMLAVLAEPDFSTTIFIGCIAVVMLFAAGAPLWYFPVILLAGMIFFYIVFRIDAGRWERLQAWMDPTAFRQGAGYQICKALDAIRRGGFGIHGIRSSTLPGVHMPEAHTDFIFAVAGETFGIPGMVTIITLFGMVAWRGMVIARQQKEHFSALLATGLTTLLVMQALINIAVAINLLPTTGLPLPFISYGRTSLVVSMVAIGLLLNLSRGKTIVSVPAE